MELSDPFPWKARNTLPADAGIYVISRNGMTVYIGRTWSKGGLRGRIRQFHRSATTGRKGHAGGVTYHGMFGPDVEELSVQVHVPTGIETDEAILRPYINYAERRFIWKHVERHRKLPACNSE